MIQSMSSTMINSVPVKRKDPLLVDENKLAKTVENRHNPKDNRDLEKPVNNSASAQSSLLSALKQRAAQLLAEAEALIQRIGFASKEQVPELAKKLKQITNDLKQLAARQNAMKSGSASLPAVNIGSTDIGSTNEASTDLSMSTSVINASRQANDSLALESVKLQLLVAGDRSDLQAKAINTYESVKQASILDDSVETNDTPNTPENADTTTSSSEGEGNSNGISDSLKKIQELIKLAAELLKRRMNEIEDSNKRKTAEDVIREVESDLSTLGQMIDQSEVSVPSGVTSNQTETSSLAINTTFSIPAITNVSTSISSWSTSTSTSTV